MQLRPILLILFTALGLTATARAQTPQATTKLSFDSLASPTRIGIDSFFDLVPGRTSLSLMLTFNNSCNLRPRGTYVVLGDTVSILLWHVPKLSPPAICAGTYLPMVFGATIRDLPRTRYVVRVAFRSKSLWSREPMLRSIELPSSP